MSDWRRANWGFGRQIAGAALLAVFIAAWPLVSANGQSASDVQLRRQADADILESLPAADMAAQLLRRGQARLALGRNDEAMIDFTLAINQHGLSAPDQAKALVGRATALEAMGNKAQAVADYEGALRAAPGMPEATQRLARLKGTSAPQEAPQITVPSEERIILKPPPQVAAPFVTLKPPPAPADEAPIVLKPPPGVVAPLALKPSISDSAALAGTTRVQLGSWRSQAEADQGWAAMREKAGDLLQEFSPTIAPVNLAGKGRYFRLRLGPMDKGKAADLCVLLRARKMDCLITP